VQGHRRERARLLERTAGATATDHEVLGNRLEPVDARGTSEDFGIVDRAEADAVAEVWQGEPHQSFVLPVCSPLFHPGGTAGASLRCRSCSRVAPAPFSC
jgi:hypothetical protein